MTVGNKFLRWVKDFFIILMKYPLSLITQQSLRTEKQWYLPRFISDNWKRDSLQQRIWWYSEVKSSHRQGHPDMVRPWPAPAADPFPLIIAWRVQIVCTIHGSNSSLWYVLHQTSIERMIQVYQSIAYSEYTNTNTNTQTTMTANLNQLFPTL